MWLTTWLFCRCPRSPRRLLAGHGRSDILSRLLIGINLVPLCSCSILCGLRLQARQCGWARDACSCKACLDATAWRRYDGCLRGWRGSPLCLGCGCGCGRAQAIDAAGVGYVQGGFGRLGTGWDLWRGPVLLVVVWEGVGIGAALPLGRSLEQALLIRRLWAWRVWEGLRRSPSPFCEPRGLYGAIWSSSRPAIASHGGSVRVVGIESGARGWRRGARSRRAGRGSPLLFEVPEILQLGLGLGVAQWRVAGRRQGLLDGRRTVVFGVGQRGGGRVRGRCWEGGHRRGAREDGLARAAR